MFNVPVKPVGDFLTPLTVTSSKTDREKCWDGDAEPRPISSASWMRAFLGVIHLHDLLRVAQNGGDGGLLPVCRCEQRGGTVGFRSGRGEIPLRVAHHQLGHCGFWLRLSSPCSRRPLLRRMRFWLLTCRLSPAWGVTPARRRWRWWFADWRLARAHGAGAGGGVISKGRWRVCQRSHQRSHCRSGGVCIQRDSRDRHYSAPVDGDQSGDSRCFGAIVPLALAMKVDPAISATVFVTTATDVFGFGVLGLASVFIR